MVIIIGGIIAFIVGLWLILGSLCWGKDLLVVVKGCISAILVIGGIIAVVVGVGNVKDESASSKKEEEKSTTEKKEG